MSSKDKIEKGIGSTIVSAEVAVGEEDFHTAEKALMKALSDVRRKKSEAAQGGDR